MIARLEADRDAIAAKCERMEKALTEAHHQTLGAAREIEDLIAAAEEQTK